MTAHRIYVPTVHAEDLLQLPEGIHITASEVSDGDLVLIVASEEDLGALDVNALYGNIEEDGTTLHFGLFEAR